MPIFPLSIVPRTIPGLFAWYDASDTSAANIVQSGGFVSQLSDKSGYNNHLTQPTGANQPVTNSSTINGLNVISFDGVAQNLLSTSSVIINNLSISAPLTIVIIYKLNSVSVNSAIMQNSRNSSDLLCVGFRTSSTQSCIRYRTTVDVANLSGTTSSTSTTYIFISTFDGSSTLSLKINGAVGAGSGSPSLGITPTGTFYLGRRMNTPDYFPGLIGELMFFNKILSTSDQNTINNYAANKWAASVIQI